MDNGAFWYTFWHIGLPLAAILAVAELLFLAAYQLAKKDIFFTFVEEGTAKAIMWNGEFDRIVMSFENHRLVTRDDEPGHSKWNVVPEPGKKTGSLIGLGGLRWIGIPPFVALHQYRFEWTSIEQRADKFDYKLRNELISHIFLKEDTYSIFIDRAETGGGKRTNPSTGVEEEYHSEQIPVNLHIALTARVVNPYKALFRVEHWLETISNQLASEVREFVGKRTFDELNQKMSSSAELFEQVKTRFDDFKENYGVEVRVIQIMTVDPGSELARKFIDGLTQEALAMKAAKAEVAKAIGDRDAKIARAEGEAKAIEIVAQAEKDRITSVYGAVSEENRGLYIFDQIKNSKLNAIGGEVMSTILIGKTEEPEKKEEGKKN